ncbi:hypothetical protein, partial [Dyadobacter chenhuakuii]
MKLLSYLFALLFSIPAFSQTEVICGSPTPSGWITTSINGFCISNGQRFPSRTIKKIDDLPAGTEVAVCGTDPTPQGWVTISRATSYCANV